MEGREKEERNINVWLALLHPILGTWPTTQACALTGILTVNPLVHRLALSPLSLTSQGQTLVFSLPSFGGFLFQDNAHWKCHRICIKCIYIDYEKMNISVMLRLIKEPNIYMCLLGSVPVLLTLFLVILQGFFLLRMRSFPFLFLSCYC